MRTFNILVFIILAGCSETKVRDQNIIADIPPIFGTYSYKHGGHGIVLNSDSTYRYYWGGCLESGRDSGKYAIKRDTLYFISLLKSNTDTVKKLIADTKKKTKNPDEFIWTLPFDQGHGQITPITNEKYLIRNSRIYYRQENGKYDMKLFWLKSDAEDLPYEVLDSTGNGYATFYNGRHKITREGLFKKFTLIDGNQYHYDNDDNIKKIEIFKNSLKIRDSFVVKKPTSNM